MSVMDPYKVLQVDPDADREVIEAAYRRLARKHHPDVSPDPDSTQRMIAINAAWEQLRDPVRRAAVDRARKRTAGNTAWVAAAAAHTRTAGPTSSAGPTRRPSAAPMPAAPPTGHHAPGQERPFGSMSEPPYAPSSTPGGSGVQGWTTARVPIGGFASGAAIRPDGEGSAGPPPGKPSGSVLYFGRFSGWSLGEIARVDIEYLEWLDRVPIGRVYQHEIDGILRAKGRRSARGETERGRGGPFRRR